MPLVLIGWFVAFCILFAIVTLIREAIRDRKNRDKDSN